TVGATHCVALCLNNLIPAGLRMASPLQLLRHWQIIRLRSFRIARILTLAHYPYTSSGGSSMGEIIHSQKIENAANDDHALTGKDAFGLWAKEDFSKSTLSSVTGKIANSVSDGFELTGLEKQLPSLSANIQGLSKSDLISGPALAAGTGMLVGGALTAGFDVGTYKLIEPVAQKVGAIMLLPLSTQAAGRLWYAPPAPWYEAVVPKRVAVGAAIGAAAAVGVYELYKRL
ncbi:MAG: hypothetical protein K2X81_08320, partial [Candidatus Obscuribacterales bacterium]|nr:hypothetical protein [Candidatus Obscuribacterales bacterium]